MAPHSSTLAWKISWTEEPGRLQSMGSLRVGHDWATSLSLFTFHFHALEKAMATHSSVLAWRIPGTGEPGGLPSMGSHRVEHDWSDSAAAESKVENLSRVTIRGQGSNEVRKHLWSLKSHSYILLVISPWTWPLATITKVIPYRLFSPVTLPTKGMRENGNLSPETHLGPSAHTFSIDVSRPSFAVCVCDKASVYLGSPLDKSVYKATCTNLSSPNHGPQGQI